jgi:hypothetical protein
VWVQVEFHISELNLLQSVQAFRNLVTSANFLSCPILDIVEILSLNVIASEKCLMLRPRRD